ncbi:MAG: hypothetical protein ACRC6I_01000, partial [Paracoccaceae bacterium]
LWNARTRGPERLWFAQQTTTPRATTYTNGPIYLQFGGQVDRDAAIAIARQLGALGWPVAGGDQGGEQLTTLPDTNEVRFFDPGAAEDALALARTIKSERPGAEVSVRDFSKSGLIAPPGLLEIWLAN